MNPFLSLPKERLSDWKDFRKSLSTHDEKTQLDLVAKYWSQAPLSKIAYDPDCPKSWPTPWEMIDENNWCRSSVAIGMFHTLVLSGWKADRLDMRLIIDQEIEDMMLVLIIDSSVILNYDWGSVANLPDSFRTIRSYHWTGKHFLMRY